jgi:hypothetical protein
LFFLLHLDPIAIAGPNASHRRHLWPAVRGLPRHPVLLESPPSSIRCPPVDYLSNLLPPLMVTLPRSKP